MPPSDEGGVTEGDGGRENRQKTAYCNAFCLSYNSLPQSAARSSPQTAPSSEGAKELIFLFHSYPNRKTLTRLGEGCSFKL